LSRDKCETEVEKVTDQQTYKMQDSVFHFCLNEDVFSLHSKAA